MAIDFINDLAVKQAEIPPVVSRLAGFFLAMQILLIIFQKKNDPSKDIWEPISDVLLAGLIVYIFPEAIRFIELLVNTLCHVEAQNSSCILEYIKETTVTTVKDDSTFAEKVAPYAIKLLNPVEFVSFAFAENVLKPLADIVNMICFPTYLIIRACCLKVVYWIAPLVLVLGAMPPFRSLWKQWFMVYIALLVCAPALILANDFCEDCFDIYIVHTDSQILGFFIIAIARFKVFQAVIDLCYRIFRV